MHPDPNRIREWRRAHGWTLQQLAEACGTSKSQIDKLEKGERRLTAEWMVRLAKPLNRDPRELLVSGSGFRPAPPDAGGVTNLPVYGLHANSKNEFTRTKEPVDQVPRPYFLMHARDAYALFVPEDSMAPMYRARQLLFVSPWKQPVPHGGVVATLKDGEVLLRAFVKTKVNGTVLRVFQPKAREHTVPDASLVSLHAIVGVIEP